jgi:hypothetical protein
MREEFYAGLEDRKYLTLPDARKRAAEVGGQLDGRSAAGLFLPPPEPRLATCMRARLEGRFGGPALLCIPWQAVWMWQCPGSWALALKHSSLHFGLSHASKL